ncbi:MAG: fumarylacetoacetate hydrolase family protein [Spirochaetes bacterium]|nr:fumarylacetoacetate hydrolase family protein [Spirochaetota bacterium]
MKLATYRADGRTHFGVVMEGHAVPFTVLNRLSGESNPELADMGSYLKNLPGSEISARRLFDHAVKRIGELGDSERHGIGQLRFLPPLAPPALLDFGLSPRHLKNSAMTLLDHEYGPLLRRILGPFVRRRIDRMSETSTPPYYKCNHNEIIGDLDAVWWPPFTSYLDIEPELGVVTGTTQQPIAGYLIFNDISARDVQMPEMMGTGPARSKDFSRSNGLGPCLVTADEIAAPLSLAVTVTVGDRYTWRGSTAEYTRSPREIVDYLHTIFTPRPGTILGMGTIPGCTGLDHDLWLRPGDLVTITFDGIGSLRQAVPAAIGPLEPSRWRAREELEAHYGHRP